MQTAALESLRRCELDITKIKLIIPHQANRRIIDAVGKRLGAKPEQIFVTSTNTQYLRRFPSRLPSMKPSRRAACGRATSSCSWFSAPG